MSVSQEDRRKISIESAEHWEALADREEALVQWYIDNKIVHKICPEASAHRIKSFRRCAKGLRLEAEDGQPRCGCHSSEIHIRDKCPNDPTKNHHQRYR